MVNPHSALNTDAALRQKWDTCARAASEPNIKSTSNIAHCDIDIETFLMSLTDRVDSTQLVSPVTASATTVSLIFS